MEQLLTSNTRECNDKKTKLIRELILAKCLKIGEFTLKNGASSPYYIDLREATMHLSIFHDMVELIKNQILHEKQDSDWTESDKTLPVAVSGVPYGVVPIASAVAYACRIAYYPVRKEVKEYGHKPDTNAYNNFEYIIIEDVMSSGSSIIDTLKKMGDKKVTDVIIIVDRELGGEEKLKAEYPQIKLHSLIKVSEILSASKEL